MSNSINSIPCTVRYQDGTGKFHLAPGASAFPAGVLDILDQTKLPQACTRLQLSTPEAVYEAIKQLQVRGAPAIGCAAALGLAVCAQRIETNDLSAFKAELRRIADYLNSSRPTAVNLSWALKRCLAAMEQAGFAAPEALTQLLLDEALRILDEDRRLCAAIGKNGASLLKSGMGVLTHCNAGALATGGIGTALAPVYTAAGEGKTLKVYSDETRPLLQGARLTAWELSVSGMDVTTICDSMAGALMKKGAVQIVIVGADRVAANGDTANKIGTYQLAITAAYHKIPFYVALPFSTIDYNLPSGALIPIEERKAEEIFHCEQAKVWNPAFDVTPHELITGFITERGVFAEIPAEGAKTVF